MKPQSFCVSLQACQKKNKTTLTIYSHRSRVNSIDPRSETPSVCILLFQSFITASGACKDFRRRLLAQLGWGEREWRRCGQCRFGGEVLLLQAVHRSGQVGSVQRVCIHPKQCQGGLTWGGSDSEAVRSTPLSLEFRPSWCCVSWIFSPWGDE